jgi:hypothetical protein
VQAVADLGVRAEVLLRQLGEHRVVRVHDVAGRRETGLADQLGGVELLAPGELGEG